MPERLPQRSRCSFRILRSAGYKEGEYGIRIENLVLVVEKAGGKLGFKTLTLAPFDESLIEWDILTKDEKDWIEGYNERISENI